MSATPRGRFVWYQLNAVDVDAARDFYTALLGWNTDQWDNGDDEPYTMFVRGEVPIGGIMALPDEARTAGAPQHWLAYISSPDVDKTVMKARDHGAQVYVPTVEMPEVGRFSVLADPQGASFAAYTPAEAPEDSAFDPQIGDASWHELMTTDYEKASGFYTDLFGWERIEDMDMGEMGIYRIFGRQGKALGGMFNKTADMPAPPNWLIYFRVKNVDDGVKKVKALGGQILNGPMEVPGGDQIAQCMDPQGGAFAIHSTAD